jgi:hypothetical protein
MKIVQALLCFLMLSKLANAQTLVALHHQGAATYFNGINGFVQAYNNAVNGDTIYIPGGFYSSPGNFDKRLTIFGAGHYPDSTLATEKTIITSGISFSDNADNFHLEGLQVNGDIYFANDQSVNNLTIRRCSFNTIDFQGDYTNPCINNLITQCVIHGSVVGSNAQSLLVTNNIIAGKIFNMNTNVIQNNVILSNFYTGWPHYSSASFFNMNNSTIRNNVAFTSEINAITGSGNIVKNNVFSMNWNQGSNIASGNYVSVDLSTFFISQSGNSFDYAHNYHLSSPAIYVGEDGSEVGIYGNFLGYKEGAVPVNPHIQTKVIAPQTNQNGELQILIHVESQNK